MLSCSFFLLVLSGGMRGGKGRVSIRNHSISRSDSPLKHGLRLAQLSPETPKSQATVSFPDATALAGAPGRRPMVAPTCGGTRLSVHQPLRKLSVIGGLAEGHNCKNWKKSELGIEMLRTSKTASHSYHYSA